MQADVRLKLWPAAIEKIEERPLTGFGFGRGIVRGELLEEFPGPLWHPHNLILAVAVQTGVLGAALFLLLIGTTAYRGWALARHAQLSTALCGAGLLAIVSGMFIRNMTDTLLVRQNALLYWGVLGLLLAWGAHMRKSGAPPLAGHSRASG